MTWQLANGLGSGSVISTNFLKVPVAEADVRLVRNPDLSQTSREVRNVPIGDIAGFA